MIDRKALAAAFPATIPVLMGYLAIGVAFGLMLQEIGYNFIWAFFMSTAMTINRAVMAKSMPVVSMGMRAPATAPMTEPNIQ